MDTSTPPLAAPVINRSAASPDKASSLTEFIGSLKMGRHWDLLAFTDGSGQKLTDPGGYAAVMIHSQSKDPDFLFGSASRCTSQQAEVRAVFELANYLLIKNAGQRTGGYLCHLVTDSSYVDAVLTAVAADPVSLLKVKSHLVLWTGIQQAFRHGIRIVPHLLPRNSNPLMTLADSLSKAARKGVTNVHTEPIISETVDHCSTHWSIDRRLQKFGRPISANAKKRAKQSGKGKLRD